MSCRSNGAVRCFATNTHSGLSHGFNEDRVSVVLNLKKPLNK